MKENLREKNKWWEANSGIRMDYDGFIVIKSFNQQTTYSLL